MNERLLELNNEINTCEERLLWLDRNINRGMTDYKEEYELLKDKVYLLEEEKEKIINSTIISSSNLVKSNDYVDLYKDDVNYYGGTFYIAEHDSNNAIGYIEVQPLVGGRNNIGYHIYTNYRGHNYSLQALVLVAHYLYERNIVNIELYALDSNIASKKILEKFNKLFPATNISKESDSVLYFIDLEKVFRNEKSNKYI